MTVIFLVMYWAIHCHCQVKTCLQSLKSPKPQRPKPNPVQPSSKLKFFPRGLGLTLKSCRLMWIGIWWMEAHFLPLSLKNFKSTYILYWISTQIYNLQFDNNCILPLRDIKSNLQSTLLYESLPLMKTHLNLQSDTNCPFPQWI